MALAAGACAAATDPAESVLQISGELCNRDMVATAVVVDEGLVLTNAHNVAGSEGPLTLTSAGGRQFAGEVVALDAERDLALLTVAGLSAPPLPAARTGEGEAGTILRLANDLTPTKVAYTGSDPITVVGHDMYDNPSDLRRSSVRVLADVGPGWSGAPVLDGDGRMVGVVYAESRSTGFTYAVASDEIERFIASAGPLRPLADTGPCAP